ncbi:MAG: TlpA family protein disulfide reductase [Blastocatellia bacterium]|nr:TlpA family protein disulfide reductase [Blastocatellia bacterium]
MILKQRALALALAIIFISPLPSQGARGPKVFAGPALEQHSGVDHQALDFKATDLQGKPFDATPLKGRIVLLDFWAVWCPPCLAAMPVLKKLNRDFKSKGFSVVGIAVYSGTAEDIGEIVREHKVDYTVVVGDDDLVERFEVIGYPTYFLIAPDGRIYKKYVGEVEELYNEIASDIAALQKETRPSTKPN